MGILLGFYYIYDLNRKYDLIRDSWEPLTISVNLILLLFILLKIWLLRYYDKNGLLEWANASLLCS